VSRKERQQPNPQQQSIDSVDDIEGKLQQAISFYRVGQLQQAEQICQQILRDFPKHAETLHLLGIIAYQVGEYKIATDLITRAIEVDSKQSPFYYSLGNSLRGQGKLEKAIEAYHQAIQIQPNHAEAYNNLGTVFIDQDRIDDAIETYQQAIRIQPDHGEAYYNLGNAFHSQTRLEEAVQSYHQAIQIQPNRLEAYNNLGVALIDQGKLEESIQIYQKTLEIQPNCADAYNNLGNVLREQGRLKESIQAYQKTLEIQPNCADAYSNLGIALKEQGRLKESIQAYQKAIYIQAGSAAAHNNLGQILLLLGDFHEGWREYEWRLKCDDINSKKRTFPQPSWDGTNLDDKTILIWAEQGIGDEIMFTSILPNLSQMTEKIIIECDQRLTPLFRRSFPQIQFFSRANPPHPRLLDKNIDYQMPIGGLGQWFRTNEKSFLSGQDSYLHACPKKVLQMKRKYQQLAAGKLLVGISWKSTGINQRRASLKSTVLKDWTSILSGKNCFFISLQYGDVKAEINTFTNQTEIPIYQDKEIDSFQSLDDFSAQVAALDLVISIDNTTVHMAGALGEKVWTLLPYIPDWRWMLEREDTPWYPSMKLFRQSEAGDWSRVFAQVRSALEQYMEHSTAEGRQ